VSDGPEHIVVEVNPDFQELIPGFLTNRTRELAELQDALERGDFAHIHGIGHRLRGVAGSYGFSVLTPLAVGFERAGRNESEDECRRVIEEYAQILPRLRVTYPEPDA
jgi:HPt (histidine-containing phosphotransfer) domain-containing protein